MFLAHSAIVPGTYVLDGDIIFVAHVPNYSLGPPPEDAARNSQSAEVPSDNLAPEEENFLSFLAAQLVKRWHEEHNH